MQISINVPQRCVTVGNKQVYPSYTELEILRHLASTPRRVWCRDELAVAAGIQSLEPRVIDQHVARIRKKLGAQAIRTLPGAGYSVDGGMVLV